MNETTDENIFHICNRGVEKRTIFLNDNDYRRFLENAYRSNNRSDAIRFRGTDLFFNPPPQEKIVDILKWSLLPNHYHLLVVELIEGGAIEFTKRLGNGYTKYFNIKYDRSGYLFQNKAQIIEPKSHAHNLYLPLYVELNPLDLIEKTWREQGMSNKKKTLEFLMNYPWSSFQTYFGKSPYIALTNKEKFYELFETTETEFKNEIDAFLKSEIPYMQD